MFVKLHKATVSLVMYLYLPLFLSHSRALYLFLNGMRCWRLHMLRSALFTSLEKFEFG